MAFDEANGLKVSAYAVIKRSALIFIPIYIILVAALSISFYVRVNSDLSLKRDREVQSVSLAGQLISGFTKPVAHDLVYLAKMVEQCGVFSMRDQIDTIGLKRIQTNFMAFSGSHPEYDQIRFLDDRGVEMVRVNHAPNGPILVPDRELQNKGKRYYFTDAFRLDRGQIFISPLDLNIENGQIEQPLKPMLRYGTPVFDLYSQKRGIVLINVLGAPLLEKFAGLDQQGNPRLMLLNSDGYWLKGPNLEYEWAFMYEDRKQLSFANLYPKAWREINNQKQGQFETADGVFSFNAVYPLYAGLISSTGASGAYQPSSGQVDFSHYHWLVVSFLPASKYYATQNKWLIGIIIVLGGGGLALGFVSWKLAHAGLIRRLAEETLARSRDELELKVRQRTEELQDANLQLTKEIAERNAAQAALKESEAKYRGIMDSTEDPVYICDQNRVITYMNPAMIRRVGRDASGETCHTALYETDRRCEWCVFNAVLAGESVSYEMEDPESSRLYHVSNSSIHHADGSISKLTIFRDITELRTAEEEKKKLERQLYQSQKLEAVGALAGGIAHDFNNILGAILGYSELALTGLNENNPARDYIAQVMNAGQRAADLVQQILRFSRQSEGVKAPIQVGPIIKEALKLLRASMPANIEFRSEIKDDAGSILADPTRLHQVIMNLATNACHAMRESGGVLSVKLERVTIEGTDGRLYDKEPGPYLRLVVSDTGHGIPEDIKAKIFDPFFTTKGVGEGTGLGLSVVHGIIKDLGGSISVYSDQGKGTSFHLFFPLIQTENDEISVDAKRPIPHGVERILLVDDESPLVDVGILLLSSVGYQVSGVTSSLEGLKRFQSNPTAFDLVLTDQNMPQMNGSDMAKEMMAVRPDIPIILCSGFSEDMSPDTAAAIGISGFLYKPLVLRDLAFTIRQVLDRNSVQPGGHPPNPSA